LKIGFVGTLLVSVQGIAVSTLNVKPNTGSRNDETATVTNTQLGLLGLGQRLRMAEELNEVPSEYFIQ